jgi:hypothetical protein
LLAEQSIDVAGDRRHLGGSAAVAPCDITKASLWSADKEIASPGYANGRDDQMDH